MKKVYIVHGWDGSPEEPMLQWLKVNLEEKGYVVEVPKMPVFDQKDLFEKELLESEGF